MSTKHTHVTAFKHFGIALKNPRWNWSGRDEDGKNVAVTLWRDELRVSDGKLVYSAYLGHDKRPGARELRENLEWAQENYDGHFRVVIAVAKDPSATSRAIKVCYPTNIEMRLTKLANGAFTAEADLLRQSLS